MNDLDARLLQCFAAVFPRIPAASLSALAAAGNSDWDSLATVSLLLVLEEEFGIQIPPSDIPVLLSFASVRDYIQRRTDTV